MNWKMSWNAPFLVAAGGAVDVDHLMPGDGTVPVRELETVEALVTPSAHGSLWEMERDLIFKTLAKVKDNRTHAAKELGISIRTLRNKLREYRDMGYQVEAKNPNGMFGGTRQIFPPAAVLPDVFKPEEAECSEAKWFIVHVPRYIDCTVVGRIF